MTATKTQPKASAAAGSGAREQLAYTKRAAKATDANTDTAALRDLVVSFVHKLDRDNLETAALRLGLIERTSREIATGPVAGEDRDHFPPFIRTTEEKFWEEIEEAEARIDAGEGVPYEKVKALLKTYQ